MPPSIALYALYSRFRSYRRQQLSCPLGLEHDRTALAIVRATLMLSKDTMAEGMKKSAFIV
jgi:hypothetical protein